MSHRSSSLKPNGGQARILTTRHISDSSELSDVELEDSLDTETGGDTTISDGESTDPEHTPGRWIQWEDHQRKQLELTFAMAPDYPIGGSWEKTETYVMIKDEEMLDYLADFPIRRWAIQQEEAVKAYKALLARYRFRDKGQSIFHKGRPRWIAEKSPFKKAIKVVPCSASEPLIQLAQSYVQHAEPRNPHSSSNKGYPSTLSAHAEATLPAAHQQANPPRTGYPHQMAPPQGSIPAAGQSADNGLNYSPSLALLRAHSASWQYTPVTLPPARSMQPLTTSETPIESPRHEPVQRVRPNRERSRSGRLVPSPRVTASRRSSQVTEVDRESRVNRFSRHLNASTITRDTTPPPYAIDPALPRTSLPDYPWQVTYAAENAMRWDDSIYPAATVERIATVQEINEKKVEIYMSNKDGAKKKPKVKRQSSDAASPNFGPNGGSDQRNSQVPKEKRHNARKLCTDQKDSLSGHLKYVKVGDGERCRGLGFSDIGAAVDAAMRDPFNENLSSIMVYNDPGDSLIDGLTIPYFSIMDVARTRLQLAHLRIYPDKAADRLIDFCPDMLMTFKLLKLIAETYSTNGSIQQRLGRNGNMTSDSTVTKRITAALEKSHDREGALAAARRDPNYKTNNRKTHNKYKAWHDHRRSARKDDPSTFDLATAAERYIASKSGHAPTTVPTLVVKEKRERSGTPSTMTDMSSREPSPSAEVVPDTAPTSQVTLDESEMDDADADSNIVVARPAETGIYKRTRSATSSSAVPDAEEEHVDGSPATKKRKTVDTVSGSD